MLEEIFKKESITAEDMVVINKHFDLLTHDQLVRLGFVEAEVIEEAPKAKRTKKN
jgi:hypothetical protein